MKIKLLVDTKEEYKKVVELLQSKQTEFHSYQLKEEKPYRVILKNIHQTTEKDEIKNALEEQNHCVINVNCIRSKKNR